MIEFLGNICIELIGAFIFTYLVSNPLWVQKTKRNWIKLIQFLSDFFNKLG